MQLNPTARRLVANLSTCCLTRPAATATGSRANRSPLHAAASLARPTGLFRPIYSLAKHQGRSPFHASFQKRLLANASSGYFAPSSTAAAVAQRQHYSKEPRAIFNVFESSDHLPSLPVPQLEDTLELLKETIWPIAMNSVEFANALHLIDKFSKSAGPKLDLLLREKAKQTKNWLTHDWWVREIYLKSRLPLVINSNPSMIYPNLPFEVDSQRSFVQTTAQLISGVIDFKLALAAGLNPEATSSESQFHLDPFLCYDQYKNLFGSLRVPGEQCDSLALAELPVATSPEGEQSSLSVVLSFRGKFFEIQLNDATDEQSRLETLTHILEQLVESSQSSEAASGGGEPGVGVLTASRRDQWARAYKLLDADSLGAIKRAQFVVCLDTIEDCKAPSESSPATDESLHVGPLVQRQQQQDLFLNPLTSAPPGSERRLAALARQILHCDRRNVANRWFDKPIQLVVVANESLDKLHGAGINYEHSLAEAVVVTKMIEHSFDKTVERQREQSRGRSGESKNLFNTSERIEFTAQKKVADSDGLRAGGTVRQLSMLSEGAHGPLLSDLVKQAQADYVSQIGQFDLSCLCYKSYGSNSIKSWHFSPDSWFQVALQWAYYNLHKRPGPCYESASTRRFAYGRTETIRSLTKDVAEFCMQPGYETLKSAIASHKTYAIAANNAAAIDRALFAYRMIFNELKSNSWRWGLPSFEAGPSSLSDEPEPKGCASVDARNGSPATGSRTDRPEVKLDHLFSEKELNTLSAFFNNELIERSRRFALSTSQVSSQHSSIFMSFGPLLADGYGCCYNISGQQIVASISANSSNQSFSCEVNQFNESLRDALDRMRDIVEEQRKSG